MRSRFIRRMLFLAVAPMVAFVRECPAEDWPQWRGPTRDCQIARTEWPDALDGDHLQKQWQVPLGPGYSGPIVVGSRVFVTETRDASHEVVRALDRKTGEELWRDEWPGAMKVPFFAAANGSWIRSTPACDGKYLFVMGMRDVLVAIDVASGQEAWRVDFTEAFDTPLPAFGAVCSPLLDDDNLYVQAAFSAVKLRKSDGQILWRSNPDRGGTFGQGMGGSPFSSPVIATLAGKRQLIVQSRTELKGIDLGTGGELWSQSIPATRGMNILTPLPHGDQVFTSSHGGATFLFSVANSDHETDHGKNGAAEQQTIHETWQTKQQAYMSSPVLIGDDIYLHLRNQRLVCLDIRSGETRWTTKPFGKYWSMVVNGDRILSLDDGGELRLIAASPTEYSELSKRKVSEQPAWAHLAISGNQLFVRSLDSIAAWQWK